jgi:hypothetical protein
MPIHIDPERRDYPPFVPDSLDRRIVDYLRGQNTDYPLTRLRTELRLLDDINSQIHSVTWRAHGLDERKSVLLVDQSSYRAIARPKPPGDDLRGPSLFRKPGENAMVEVSVPEHNEKQQTSIAAELEEISGETARLREQRATLSAKAYPLTQRVAPMKKFINQRMASGQKLRCLPLPALDTKRSLDQLRETINQLAADVKEYEASPVPAAVAKEKAAQWVASLARSPYVGGLLDPGDGLPDLPRVIVGDREQIDWGGVFAWLNRDALIERLHKQIDEAADDTRALDDATRDARIREAKEKIIETERIEEAAVWAALQAGAPVTFRADASPAVIMSVEGE